jgi:hypothetical protein
MKIHLENMVGTIKVVTSNFPRNVGERAYFTEVHAGLPFQDDLGTIFCTKNYSSSFKAIIGHFKTVMDVCFNPRGYALST